MLTEFGTSQRTTIAGSASDVRHTLARAAWLARSGRYSEAEQLLAITPITSPLATAVLDLRAKVCAQQGRDVEAAAFWMEALRRSPANQEYRKALDCLLRLRHPLWGVLRAGLVVSIIAILIAGTALFIDHRLGLVLDGNAALRTAHAELMDRLAVEQRATTQSLDHAAEQLQGTLRRHELMIDHLTSQVGAVIKAADAQAQAASQGHLHDVQATLAAIADLKDTVAEGQSGLVQSLNETQRASEASAARSLRELSDVRQQLLRTTEGLHRQIEEVTARIRSLKNAPVPQSRPATAPSTATREASVQQGASTR